MNWTPPNKVIIQGITESKAAFYTAQMKNYGTDIVAGISPGQGDRTIDDIPIFDLVEQVLTAEGGEPVTMTEEIDASLIFVPPYQVLDAVKEAIALGIKKIIILTPNVPPLDTIELIKYAQASNTLILGPGSDGIIIPDRVWLGRLQPKFFQSGKVGLITSSQDLSYEVAAALNQANIGQSIVVSLGSDRIVGSGLSQWLSILNEDPDTEVILTIGQQISHTEEIAAFCKNKDCHKPIISYVAGLKTPQETAFRDAVTIISNHLSASIPVVNQERRILNKLKKSGVKIAKRPSDIPAMVSEILDSQAD